MEGDCDGSGLVNMRDVVSVIVVCESIHSYGGDGELGDGGCEVISEI